MLVDLAKPQDLPSKYLHQLEQFSSLCKSYSFEKLQENEGVWSLICDLDNYCASRQIVGIHYTRANRDSIKSRGLIIRTGDQIRKDFLADYASAFTFEQVTHIKETWASFFDSIQQNARDSRIFFNFTANALLHGGARPLLRRYGGEQISKCFSKRDEIGVILSNLGSPLIVKCALNPADLTAFTEKPWGKILLSSFQTQVNPSASRFDQDGYQVISVLPKDILHIDECDQTALLGD